MNDTDKIVFWLKVFFKGGALMLAVICIFIATRNDTCGTFAWLVWMAAILLLLMQAGRWFIIANGARIPDA